MENMEFLKIVTNETRLRILNLLFCGKCCESMIKEVLKEDESDIEKGINKLKKHNIISAEKNGDEISYVLSSGAISNIDMVQNIIGGLCTGGIYLKDRKCINEFKKQCRFDKSVKK